MEAMPLDEVAVTEEAAAMDDVVAMVEVAAMEEVAAMVVMVGTMAVVTSKPVPFMAGSATPGLVGRGRTNTIEPRADVGRGGEHRQQRTA